MKSNSSTSRLDEELCIRDNSLLAILIINFPVLLLTILIVASRPESRLSIIMSGWDDFPAPAAPAWDDNATFASNNHGTFSGKEDVANDFGGNGAVGIDDHGGENRNCNNCGQPSHIRADCTEAAKEFDGECNLCHLVGHRAAQCPTAPPKTCKNCLEDGTSRDVETPEKLTCLGHVQMTCQNPRKINRDHIESVNKDDAWSKLKSASAENDIDDMLEAVQMYIKAVPEITYPQLETALRADNIGLFIIATKREIADTFTLMDLQGNLQREWAISYRRSPKAQRGRETQNWPASPEENMERLLNAGEVVSTGVPKVRYRFVTPYLSSRTMKLTRV